MDHRLRPKSRPDPSRTLRDGPCDAMAFRIGRFCDTQRDCRPRYLRILSTGCRRSFKLVSFWIREIFRASSKNGKYEQKNIFIPIWQIVPLKSTESDVSRVCSQKRSSVLLFQHTASSCYFQEIKKTAARPSWSEQPFVLWGFLACIKRPPAVSLPRHGQSRPGRGQSPRRAGPWPRR